jgi:hypothetical protein
LCDIGLVNMLMRESLFKIVKLCKKLKECVKI